MLCLATIDNLSARSFGLAPPGFPARIEAGSPTETYERMAAGNCDAALLPLARLSELRDVVEPVGAYGIACEGAVFSVLLFAKRPLARIIADGQPVYVSEKSQTSRLLLSFLCELEFGKSFTAGRDPGKAQARLLIGNDAADFRRQEYRWPGMRDLGQWWFRLTGLPFVFARWVVRRDLDAQQKTLIRDWLEENTGLASTPEGIEDLAGTAITQGLLYPQKAFAKLYYTRVRPRLTMNDLRGAERFLNMQEERMRCAKTA